MALEKFKAAPLPNPPPQYDQQYIRQLIRVLENYFSQLDSLTPNQANSYRADNFYGGNFSGDEIEANNVTATNVTALAITSTYLNSDTIGVQYADIAALTTETAEIASLTVGDAYGGNFYGDGRYLSTPYNQITSSSDQTATNVATANAVTYDGDEFPNGISINNSSQITFADSGIYNIAYSIQLKNVNNALETVDIWLRKNGTDLAGSNTRFAIPARKSAGEPSYLVAVTPIMVDLEQVNEYIQIMWRVSNTDVTIEYLPAVTASPGVTPAIPATPSVIVGITFVSAQFPPTRRVAPLPVLGFGEIGTITVSTP